MRLTKVSVQKYRSIDRQAAFNVDDYTVLVGPNNQGKSNLLRAAVLAMEVVRRWSLDPGLSSRRLTPRLAAVPRNRLRGMNRLGVRAHGRFDYDWERDFPIFARERPGAQKSTVVNLEFELDEQEQLDFRDATNIATNHRLPVRVALSEESVTLAVPKQGKGQHQERAGEIARFISDRVALLHVPAVRPGDIALEIAEEILQSRHRALALTPEYDAAINQIRRLNETAVQDVQQLLHSTMQRFVPGMASIELEVRDLARASRLEDILIDDGVSTSISTKGDGIQSLAALALTLEWTNSRSHPDKHLIVAIEEPESHLHPGAIHELRKVLIGIASTQQVIVTTHSQSLINRSGLSKNVIVTDRGARPADSLKSLRESLGVHLSDALTTADVIVICEGTHDEKTLPLLLSRTDPAVLDHISDGRLLFEAAGGGSKIHLRVLQARTLLMEPLVVLDGDSAGKIDVEKLLTEGVIDRTRIVQWQRPRGGPTELEDSLRLESYVDAVERVVAFSLTSRQRRILESGHDAAWSERLLQILVSAGVPDPSPLVAQSKAQVQVAVEAALKRGEPVIKESFEPVLARLSELIEKNLRT